MDIAASGEVPKSVVSYRGKLLSEMTREELIFALNDMAKREEEAREKYHGVLMRTRHVRADESAVPKADSSASLSILDPYYAFMFAILAVPFVPFIVLILVSYHMSD